MLKSEVENQGSQSWRALKMHLVHSKKLLIAILFPMHFSSLSFNLGKVLITTGLGFVPGLTKTEVIDLVTSDAEYENAIADFPLPVYAASGGLISNTPLVCGGQVEGTNGSDECFSLDSKEAKFIGKLSRGSIFRSILTKSMTILDHF